MSGRHLHQPASRTLRCDGNRNGNGAWPMGGRITLQLLRYLSAGLGLTDALWLAWVGVGEAIGLVIAGWLDDPTWALSSMDCQVGGGRPLECE